MADAVIMTDEILPALEEIPNMKVTDLRKKLKAFGLPITGNKTDLVERLQEACMSAKGDSFESSHLTFDESQISELESPDGSAVIEDSALLEQEHFSSFMNSSLEEDSKVLGRLENKLNMSANSTAIAKPLKKRSITKVGDDAPVPEKKIVLNRTNIALAEFNIEPVSNPKPVTVTSNESEKDEKLVLSVKSMSAAERLAMRAKRFNVTSKAAATNSKSTNARNSKQSILSSAPAAPDLDILKKRAERFGQSVSTVMKQVTQLNLELKKIEQKEKLLKRKCKFGANLGNSAASSLNELDKKRQRAERFGIS